jgi:N-methylhydantoinase A/oxoprolinase/acetone carboxylase beta subunit
MTMFPAPAAALVGVDVGGTFTDAVVVHDGRVTTAKLPTTPEDQGLAVVASVLAALEAAGLDPSGVAGFAHGMTVGTNALLEGTGARVALVTTEGFADVVELRRQDRAHLYRLDAHYPPPIVPRERRFEVRERCGPHGVIVPLDEASLDAAVERVRASGVEAAAVGLLFSFAHPDHEQAVTAELRRRLPELHVSSSFEVLPEIREYERISTTCIDAHLAPVLGRYLRALGDRCDTAGLPRPAIMQSNGGLIDLLEASDHAAWTVLSGPAAGVLGAAHVAAELGEERVLTFDMGGTSCDVALIDGAPARTSETRINGHPLHLPMLDVHTVSAGGGSIAWADAGGALRVGPRSAGARPGPACYGRGGGLPTVTDANVVLGRIDPEAPLAGGLRIDPARAAVAVGALAATLGLSLRACGEGIVAVAVQEMARALRVVSVERGVDPREMALVAFGGAGPLHGCDVAEELGISRVILPGAAGLLAALGLVVAGERRDEVLSVLTRLDANADLSAPLATLESRLDRALPGAAIEAKADCRYLGQSHFLTVDWDPARPPELLAETFHEAHRRRFGDADPARPVEVVSIRLAGARPGVAPQIAGNPPDIPAAGPAVFALDGATGWLAPGWAARPGPSGAVILERAA